MDHETFIQALSRWLEQGERVLLTGPSGAGKSTLARQAIEASNSPISLIVADPGRPSFGPPGALALAHHEGTDWVLDRLEAIATMDCGRFRVPTLVAARRLLDHVPADQPWVLDAPGMSRGFGAKELLSGLAMVSAPTRVVLVSPGEPPADLLCALRAVHADVTLVTSHPEARKPSDAARVRARSQAWATFLEGAMPHDFSWEAVELLGTPPPREALSAWPGCQIAALGARGQTLAMGEVREATARHLHADLVTLRPGIFRTLCVRDARRVGASLKTTRYEPPAPPGPTTDPDPAPSQAFTHRDKPDIRVHLGRGPALPGGMLRATFVGGLFEDPMVVLRMDHKQRCLFLDLGEVSKVPTRVVHQTTDIFLTHAHLDHFGDVPWLLRRLVGITRPLRLFGPPGTIGRMDCAVHMATWDRIGDRGPRFEVWELHEGSYLEGALVQCGIDGVTSLGRRDIIDGVILEEPRLRVRATLLDHGTPVCAFALEEDRNFGVRGDILRARGWKAGDWLGKLKDLAARGVEDVVLEIPTDEGDLEMSSGELTALLLIERPGRTLVYATDFGDTPENRRRVQDLAEGAALFVCEASFAEMDADQAERTGHLTARACAEMARDADVRLLVPYHLSVRYERNPELVYQEILEVFERTYVPAPILERLER